MIHFRFLFPVLLLAASVIIMPVSCKTAEATTSATTSGVDTTTTQEKNPIHTSGKVQGGTIMNGPGQDNSNTGTKPKQ
jgi:uncharacterized protein (UPF0333 family)